jgi:hypothetical protein
MVISLNSNHVCTYVGLRGPSGAERSSKGPSNRKSFRHLTTAALSLIPCLPPAFASQIKVNEPYSEQVPEAILAEGLRLINDRVPVIPLSHIRVSADDHPPQTFGELVKVFERSLYLMKDPLPSGWQLTASGYESAHASVSRLIQVSERGVSVKLSETIGAPKLSLWFKVITLLDNGRDEPLEAYLPIPGLTVIDSTMAAASGKSGKV